jgi:hypothetical protein
MASCKTGSDSGKVQKPEIKILDSDSEAKEQLDTVVQSDSYELDYVPVDKNINKTLIKKNFSVDLKINLSQWVGFYEKISPDFKMSGFRIFETNILKPYQEPLGDSAFKKRFFDLYNPYLKYSPDSSKAIDLYSYTYVLDYDSEGKVVGFGDVDCQLAIVDLKKQKRIILQTFGSAGQFQDSFWLNNDSIIVAWIGTSDGEFYEPFYSVIDLKTYLTHNYKLDTDLNLSESNYADLIFKNIEFE